ncbi:MAG: Gldg family protein [Treponema sp.]
MKKEAFVQAALLSGIIIMLALVSQRIYVRLDTTQAKTYSLSPYTKTLLDNLDSAVTITWCRSYAVDSYMPSLQYMADMLAEYAAYAPQYCRVVQKDSAEFSDSALQNLGFITRQIEKKRDQSLVVENLYSGVLCEYRGKSRVIPFIADIYTLEADIARFLTELEQDAQGRRSERTVYVAMPPGTKDTRYKYVLPWLEYAGFIPQLLEPPFAVLQPEIPLLVIGSHYFTADMLNAVEVFLKQNGSAAFFVSANTVAVDTHWQAAPKEHDGLVALLARAGFELQANLIIDPLNFCLSIPSADRSRYEKVNYPFWPTVFKPHGAPLPPLISVEKPVQFFWPSQLALCDVGHTQLCPLLTSSAHAAVQKPPYNTDPYGKQLSMLAHQEQGAYIIAGYRPASSEAGRMLVVADEYCISTAIEYTQSDTNMDVMVNAVHWLMQQDALLQLKTKQPAVFPFKYIEDELVFLWWVRFARIVTFVVVPLGFTACVLLIYRKGRKKV